MFARKDTWLNASWFSRFELPDAPITMAGSRRTPRSIRMLHAAIFAVGDAFARFCQLGHAQVFVLSGFLAFGGSLVRRGHNAMAPNVVLGVFCLLRRIDCRA